MKGFEDAPTLVEEGYDLIAPSILGVVGPKEMPANVVKTLGDAFEKAMASKDFLSAQTSLGLRPILKMPKSFESTFKTR